VIDVSPIDASVEGEAWDAFLRGQRGALIYHSIRYRELLVDHLGCEPEYVVARESGEIRGVLPLMWANDAGGRVCNSLPFYGSHGSPVADGPDAERALLDAYNARVTDRSTLAGTMVANPFLGHEPPPPVHDLTDERISQVTSLPKSAHPEAVLGLIDSSARRNVRKAERLQFNVDLDPEALIDLSRIHRENMRAIGGLSKSEEFFAAVRRHLRIGEDFDLWIARSDDAIVAGLLVLYFDRVVEYFTPAIEHDHRSNQPLSLILLRAMVHAIDRGYERWNWGGTQVRQEGVYRFKRKWGAQESRYRYFIHVNDKSLLDSSAKELQERFPHFYVVPFSALRSTTAATDQR
jgi:CelD/BcsL family acetyltransferase involved in cellulose biosynthesis